MSHQGVKERDSLLTGPGTYTREQTCAAKTFMTRATGSQDHRRRSPWRPQGQPSSTDGRTLWCSPIRGRFCLSHNLSILSSNSSVPLRAHGRGLYPPNCPLRVGFSHSRWAARWMLNAWWSHFPGTVSPLWTSPHWILRLTGNLLKKNHCHGSTLEAWSWGWALDAVSSERLFQTTKSQRALWALGQRQQCLNAGFQS